MAKFIVTAEGEFIPAREVVEVKKSGRHKSKIKTRNNNYYAVNETRSTLTSQLAFGEDHSFPAAPGYSVVFALSDYDGETETLDFVRIPVIGWSRTQTIHEIPDFLGAIPIVPGEHEYSDWWGIVLPDGRVISTLRRVPLSMEDWMDAVKRAKEAGFGIDDVSYPKA